MTSEAEKPPAGQVSDADETQTRPRRSRGPNKPRVTANKGMIESAVASSLVLLNGAVIGMARVLRSQALMDDHLQPQEIAMLTDAVTAEAMTHPRVAKWLMAANTGSTHAQLAIAIITIAYPRLVRHGIIPEITTGDAPVSVETGRAYGNSGGYGEREEYASGAPISVAS